MISALDVTRACFCSIGMGGGFPWKHPYHSFEYQDKRRAQVRSRSPKVGFKIGQQKHEFGDTQGVGRVLEGKSMGQFFLCQGNLGGLNIIIWPACWNRWSCFFWYLAARFGWLSCCPWGFLMRFFKTRFKRKEPKDPKVHRISTAWGEKQISGLL